MKISKYSQDQLKSTCCHRVLLEKNGMRYTGIYNGLNNWARIENSKGQIHYNLHTEWEEDENGGYSPNFSLSWFEFYGYNVVED